MSEFFLTLILTYIFLYTFYFSKTIYIMLYSVIMFFFSFMFLIYIEFEFFAISILTIYIGGIAVMFLFLIMVIDLSDEAYLMTNDSNFLINFILILGFSLVTYYFFIAYYDPLFFRSNVSIDMVGSYRYLLNFFPTHGNVRIKFLIRDLVMIFINFNDLDILGFYLYVYFGPYIVAVGLFLLVATVVAIMVSVNSNKFLY